MRGHRLRALLLCVVIAALAYGSEISAQTTSPNSSLPVPEYFGVYGVVHGELVKLDAASPQFKSHVEVPLGFRNGVGNVLNGEPPAFSRSQKVPELPQDLNIIAFAPTTGPITPLLIAGQLTLQSLIYVRNVIVDTGWPNRVRRAGVENGWDSAEATELVGMTQGDAAASIELLLKPFPGRQDIIIAVPAKKLSPGVFRLSGPGMKTVTFAVSPVEQGQSAKCVDAEYTYAMMVSQSKFRPCTGGTQPGDQAGATISPGSTVTSESDGIGCSTYDSCVAGGILASNAKQWAQAGPLFEKASRLDPSKPDSWSARADIYLASRQYRDAPAMWNKMIETWKGIVCWVPE